MPWQRPAENMNLEWTLDTSLSSRAISSAGVGKIPPPDVERALGALIFGSLVVTGLRNGPNRGSNRVKYVIVLFLEDCAPLFGNHLPESPPRGARRTARTIGTASIKLCLGPGVNPPLGEKIGTNPQSGIDPPLYPPVLEDARLRPVASRIFLRRRRLFGVTSTYSSGAMYSSDRSRVICTGGASWMPLPSP